MLLPAINVDGVLTLSKNDMHAALTGGSNNEAASVVEEYWMPLENAACWIAWGAPTNADVTIERAMMVERIEGWTIGVSIIVNHRDLAQDLFGINFKFPLVQYSRVLLASRVAV